MAINNFKPKFDIIGALVQKEQIIFIYAFETKAPNFKKVFSKAKNLVISVSF